MRERDEIEQLLVTLNARRNKLDADHFKATIEPQLTALIGCTFIYRNDSNEREERWHKFRKIRLLAFSKYNAWIIFEECSLSSHGNATLETHAILVHQSDQVAFPQIESGWTKCDPEEYDYQRGLTLKNLETPDRLQQSLSER